MNDITAVAGVRVGQVERIGDGWLSGVSVIVPPPGSVGAVSIRGAAPATHETAALHAGASAPTPQAIALCGGSSYGLVAAHGVAARMAQAGRGYRAGTGPHDVIPLVPSAAIYDLGRGGLFGATPTFEMGHQAADIALAGGERPVRSGTVGAGTGAAILDERYKGGVGNASLTLTIEDVTLTLGALAVVNAFGGPVGATAPVSGPPHPGYPPTSTILVVLATDADLDLGTLHQSADVCHDGLARAIDPVHTLADGDTVFALSTRTVAVPGVSVRFTEPRRWRDAMIGLQAAAARVVEAAVWDGLSAASPVSNEVYHLPRHPGR